MKIEFIYQLPVTVPQRPGTGTLYYSTVDVNRHSAMASGALSPESSTRRMATLRDQRGMHMNYAELRLAD